MTISDPFSSEDVISGEIDIDMYQIIASTLLDDDPTSIVSNDIVVPNGDCELLVFVKAEATASPTSLVVNFEVTWDNSEYFLIEGSDWAAKTILAAAMPRFVVYDFGRLVAPYFRLNLVGVDTDGTDKVTVQAFIARKP